MKNGKIEREVISTLSGYIPRFSDIFDEETFYIFAACFSIASLVAAFIASRYIRIKDAGHVD